jgi:hypothetical protein
MNTMDNRVGGGTRWDGCNVLYRLSYRVISSLSVEVSALALRAVPITTGNHVTLPWTEPTDSQHILTFQPEEQPVIIRHLFLGFTI